MTQHAGVIRFVDKDNKPSRSSGPPSESQRASGSELDESYQRLQPEMRRPKPSAEAIAAALEAAQRLASEADAEDAAGDMAHDLAIDSTSGVCRVCGYRNRGGNKFCGMCGLAVTGQNESEATSVPQPARRPSRAIALHPNPFLDPEPEPEPEPETQPQQTPYDDLERRPALEPTLRARNASLPPPLPSPLFSRRPGRNGSSPCRRCGARIGKVSIDPDGGFARRYEPR